MAKGQHLSRYQTGIVKRYYNNLDGITLTKLSELVSDLAVGEEGKAAEKLWKKAAELLVKSGVEPEKIAALQDSRSVAGLAQLVGLLAGGGTGKNAAPKPPKTSRDM